MKKSNTHAATLLARTAAHRACARLAFTFAALALLVAPAGRAFAQGQPPQAAPGPDKTVSRSKVERKNRAPLAKDVLRVKLPKAQEFTLDNGLTVLVLEDHRFPVVNLSLSIAGAGPIYEPKDRPGLANITAQMLR